MNTEERGFLHKDLTEKIIEVYFQVYTEPGYGFLESVYEAALVWAFTDAGLRCERQVEIPVWFRGRKIGDFRADLLVERAVLIEIKAARSVELAFEAQMLNYLRATDIEVGLLLNFGPRSHFKRYVFSNERKKGWVHRKSSAASEP